MSDRERKREQAILAMQQAPRAMKYTVIGFIDESEDVQVAGVIEGDHEVTQLTWGRWWAVVEADSPGQAETLAISQITKEVEAGSG
jgi:hypothetical protein